MQYAITGYAPVHGDTRFALGPHGVNAEDAAHVLPEDEVRNSWDHLTARDSYIIELETMYLRGFVATASVHAFVKSVSARNQVLSDFKSFWHGWSKEGSYDYAQFFDSACTIYGALMLTAGPTKDDQALAQVIGRQFAEGCNPFGLLAENLRDDLARKGASVFSSSADHFTQLLEETLAKFNLTRVSAIEN